MKNQNVCTNPAYSITAYRVRMFEPDARIFRNQVCSKLFPRRIVSHLFFKFDGGKQQSLNFGLALMMNI